MQMPYGPSISPWHNNNNNNKKAVGTYTHPQHHNNRNEDTRAQALEQDIGQWLENRVRHEEDRQCGIVLIPRHVEVLLQSCELGIADIGAGVVSGSRSPHGTDLERRRTGQERR